MAQPATYCAIYAAKSTQDRRGSIPTQLADCRAAIEREGGRLLTGEYTDEAFSAFRGNRGPGLADAMSHVEELARESGGAELWAQHSDRLARGDGRSARHTVELALWALKHDVAVRTVQDPDTFRDLLYAVVTGQRNHEDSRRRGLSITAGRKRAAARGDWLGYKVDGYKLQVDVSPTAEIRKHLVIDPAREEIITRVFRMALKGKRPSVIARALNEAGCRTNPRRGEPAREWSVDRVVGVLKNPRYAGLSVWKGEVVARDAWPAFITEQQHYRLRARLASPRPTKTPRKRETYLLARLAKCGRCGTPLHAMTGHRRSDGTWARRYVCAAHTWRRGGRCGQLPVDADTIEQIFASSLTSFLPETPVHEPSAQSVSGSEASRRRLIHAARGGDAAEIDSAIRDLVARLAPEVIASEEAADMRRAVRDRELVGAIEAWAAEERAGRSDATRRETRRLNHLLKDRFSAISITTDPLWIVVSAQRNATRLLGPAEDRVELRIDVREREQKARADGRPHRKYQSWTDVAIIAALKAWRTANGRVPVWTDWRIGTDGYHPDAVTVQRHFGTWNKGLRKAGLKPTKPDELPRNNPWTATSVLSSLQDWTRNQGQPPSWADWLRAAPTHPCTETVRRHFGSWQNGLTAAGLCAPRTVPPARA